MKNIDYIKLGKNIRSKRLMSGLTMEQLAEKCYISTGFLGHIENGNRAPSLDTLFAISNALDCGIDSLIYDFDATNCDVPNEVFEYIKKQSPENSKKFYNLMKLLAEHINEF